MKKTLILFALITILSCNAQQIIDLEEKGTYRHYPEGAYFQDISGFLNPFTGTYLFTNGNTSLKIILGKKIKDNDLYSEDIIYGGYEYKVNGVTQVNTLPETLPLNTYAGSYFIYGNSYLLNDSHPPCNTCVSGEKRLYLSLKDGGFYRKLIVKKEIINGQEQIKVNLMPLGTVYYKENEPEPIINFAIPDGEYTLIKQ